LAIVSGRTEIGPRALGPIDCRSTIPSVNARSNQCDQAQGILPTDCAGMPGGRLGSAFRSASPQPLHALFQQGQIPGTPGDDSRGWLGAGTERKRLGESLASSTAYRVQGENRLRGSLQYLPEFSWRWLHQSHLRPSFLCGASRIEWLCDRGDVVSARLATTCK